MLSPKTLQNGRYVVEKLIAKGGSGVIYLAEDTHLKKQVAFKTPILSDKTTKRHFLREARKLSGLVHPYIPTTRDVFEEDDAPYLVMDYINGSNLRELRKANPLPINTVLDWSEQLLDVLKYLHKQKDQIIHRDIKPSNIKLSKQGNIVLLDFGLAKGTPDDQTLFTDTKSLAGGTKGFVSLEQGLEFNGDWHEDLRIADKNQIHYESLIENLKPDCRVDIFSVGATIFYLLSGKAPISPVTRLTSCWQNDADPISSLEIGNEDINLFVKKALEIMPENRFQSSDEMLEKLREIRNIGRVRQDNLKREKLIAEVTDKFLPEIDSLKSKLTENQNQKSVLSTYINTLEAEHSRIIEQIKSQYNVKSAAEVDKLKGTIADRNSTIERLYTRVKNLETVHSREVSQIISQYNDLQEDKDELLKKLSDKDKSLERIRTTAQSDVENFARWIHYMLSAKKEVVQEEPQYYKNREILLKTYNEIIEIEGIFSPPHQEKFHGGNLLMFFSGAAILMFFMFSFTVVRQDQSTDQKAKSKQMLLTGEANAEVKNYAVALEIFTEAIKLDPENEFAYFQRAYYGGKSNLRKPQEIIEDYTQVIRLDKNNVSGAYVNRCNTYKLIKEIDKAVVDCLKSIEIDSRNSLSLTTLGDIMLDEKRDFQSAYKFYTQALTVDPKKSELYLSRARAFEELKNYEAALADINKFIELFPASAIGYRFRSDFYRRTGNTVKFLEDQRKASELES